MFRYLLSAAVAFLSFSAPALALDCTPATDAIDPRCYGAAADGQNDDGPALQQAIDAAISQEKPLHLIHAHFATYEPLNIDYGAGPANGHEGFEIQSDGATIDGTPAGNVIVLTVACSSGRACFYFHQTGTLFVNGNTDQRVLKIGNDDYSDAQNSIVFDHLIVNNSGSGAGMRLNYVLSSHLNIVADTAGSLPGVEMRQTQMTTMQLAATSAGGDAIDIGADYNFGDVIQSPDFEASPTCVLAEGGNARDIAIVGGNFNCATAFVDPNHVITASAADLGGSHGGLTP
jgi:hypothetical protein